MSERLRPHTTLFEGVGKLAGAFGRSIAMRLHYELMAGDDASALSVEGLAARNRSRRPGGWRPRDNVHAHWLERPSLAEIARAGGVHPATVVRAFRRHLHCSPGQYMRRLRLDHARNSLISSGRPIAEVALEAGFCDQAHFTNAFRRHFGVTPAELRSRSAAAGNDQGR